MRKFLLVVICLLLAFASLAQGPRTTQASPAPKLVVAIVIDQFRYDYMTRFRAQYHQGFDLLLTKGAVFTNAFYDHFPTVTAVGHSTVLTGATPSLSGIVGNSWYDRASGKDVTSVSDASTQLLGGKPGAEGSSPHRLLVSTLGDEMKMSAKGEPKVIGVSIKDRAAILPSGHMADGAYWFDGATGNFVSSTFYFPGLPAWVNQFNDERVADHYLGAKWVSIENSSQAPFRTLAAAAGPAFYGSLESTPFGNDLLEAFAERTVTSEKLGGHDGPDLLTVSFSSNDYVGHRYGPDSPEVRDISVRTDRLFGKFFRFLDRQIGLANVLVVLTADHGVAPVPELMQQRKMPGGRIPSAELRQAAEKSLVERFGEGRWVVQWSETGPYLNHDLIREKKLDAAEVRRVAAGALQDLPHVARVYTWDELHLGEVNPDPVGRRIMNGFNADRVPDLFVVLDPYWLIGGASGTTHWTPYLYDAHVPVIFMGPGIRPGFYDEAIRPNDIAPTLATMLAVETPSGSVGRVLKEILVP